MKLLHFISVLFFSILLTSEEVFSSTHEVDEEEMMENIFLSGGEPQKASADVIHGNDEVDEEEMDNTFLSGDEPSSFRGASRFLAQQKLKTLTCNRNPRVCRAKGSPGPDCCKKKCVNVMTDKLNCGICGNKCTYGQICCRGNCVNPSFDKRNCGGCNRKCKKGEFCAYGMCSYA